jgi:hypothetical protein
MVLTPSMVMLMAPLGSALKLPARGAPPLVKPGAVTSTR